MIKERKIMPKWLRSVICVMIVLTIVAISAVGIANSWVKMSVDDRILEQEQAAQLDNVDCIIVLGCGVSASGKPSHMLEDRLKRGVALYENGAAPKLLMSGDHGRENYNEVAVMKRYAVDAGIPSEAVFMDHAGFSTYETMYRAKEVFCAKKVLIVTQEYHLYRALYIAEALGLDAYGVSADYRAYSGQLYRDIREVLARVKDFGTTIIKPEPTYLGEVIPISGSGELTHDESYNNIG